jgi:hypothetical protein
MKRDDMDIDEILKHYLPRASQEEVDEASNTVLNRIRSMRFQEANLEREARARAERECDSAKPQAMREAVRREARARQGEAVRDAQSASKEPDTLWLNDGLVALLTAVEQLQGQGKPVTIILRMEELMEEYVAPGPAFVSMLLMERAGLVSTSPVDSEKPDLLDERYYEITPLGKRSLAKAVARRQGVRNPLEDFA